MADIAQSSLVSSGYFKATTCTGTLSIAAGSSGTLLTVSSTGGRKIRLTKLNVASSSAESGISVVADGVTVVSNLSLAGAATSGAGQFSVGPILIASTLTLGEISLIEANSTITITKSSGSTSNRIDYALEQGF